METRRLIQSGPSSLSVTLPNKWLKDNKLKKGGDVFLDMEKSAIRILPASNIKEQAEQKEYNISTDKLYLVKEHLNYCFLHNVDTISIKTTALNIEHVLDVIEEFPGFSCTISKDTLLVKNYLDKEKIDPFAEITSILQANRSVFTQILAPEKDATGLLIRLRNFQSRTLLAERVLNHLIANPLQSNAFQKTLANVLLLKASLQGIYLLLENELLLIQHIDSTPNIEHYMHLITRLEKLLLPQQQHIEHKIMLKSLKENIGNMLDVAQHPQDVVFLYTLREIVIAIMIIHQEP